jgi:hypothetical protein
MRRVDGIYRCDNCNEVVDVPRGQDPRTVIVQGSGRALDEYVISLDHHELHRCPVQRGLRSVVPHEPSRKPGDDDE